jgi:hypothetical protein
MFVFLQEKASLSEPVQAEVAGIHFRYEALLGYPPPRVDGGHFRCELDLKMMAFSILGMCNWMFKWYSKGGRLTIDEIATTWRRLSSMESPREYYKALCDGPPIGSPGLYQLTIPSHFD